MSASNKRYLGFVILFLIGLVVSMKGTASENNEIDKYLPILGAAFVVWMHFPIHWITDPKNVSQSCWIPPFLLLVLGNLSDLIFLQACGWVWAWGIWTKTTIQSSALNAHRSAIAFLFVFPWINHDFPIIGWWYRLSGAWVTEGFFQMLGFTVERQGTEMVIGGLPMSVEAGCAGMGLLQSLLVVGTIFLLIYYPKNWIFYFLIPIIPFVAWLANTLRIVTISAIALGISVQFSQGIFHTIGGLIVTMFMVLLVLPLLQLMRRFFPDTPKR